jgi:hypothetical protein
MSECRNGENGPNSIEGKPDQIDEGKTEGRVSWQRKEGMPN